MPLAVHNDNNNLTVTTGTPSVPPTGEETIYQQCFTQRANTTNTRANINPGRTDPDVHPSTDPLLGSDGITEGTPAVARVAHSITHDPKLRIPALVLPTSSMPNHPAGPPDPLPHGKVEHTGSRTLQRQTRVSPTATTCNITLSPSLPRSQQGRGPDISPPRSSHDEPLRPVTPQKTVGSPPLWALPIRRKRTLTLHDYWCPDRPPKTSACPHPQCDCPLESSIDGQRRQSYDPIGDRPRMTPQALPHVAPCHDRASPRTPNPRPLPAPHSPPTSPPEVQFLGPAGPPVLQAVSPSGDVRLTLRRYATTDSITSSHMSYISGWIYEYSPGTCILYPAMDTADTTL